MSALLKGGDYHPGADVIQVMTMKVSKGLEFPVVTLPGVRHMPAKGEDEQEAASALCGGYAGYAEVGDGGGRKRVCGEASASGTTDGVSYT